MTEQPRYEVRVEGVSFDAAHFATFGGNCEPLHGHSYSVAAQVQGLLTDDAWVVDFTKLKAILRGLCKQFDHKVILQCSSSVLRMEEVEDAWRVFAPGGKEYSFPSSDVAGLNIDNSTAERLAEWLCGQLAQELLERGATNVQTIDVEVWEGPGQRASCRRRALPVE